MKDTWSPEKHLTNRQNRAEHYESVVERGAAEHPPHEDETDSGEPEDHRTSNLPQSGQ